MKTALGLLTISAAALCFTNTARAQYNAPAPPGDPLPSSVPLLRTGAPGDLGSPTHIITDAPPTGGPPSPGVFDPLPAENLGQVCPPDDPWIVVAPYAWIFGIKGTVGAGTRVARVDLSVQDAVHDLLPDLRGAAQLHVEGGYHEFGFIADLTYLDVQPLNGFLQVDSRSTLLELLGFYRVIDTGRGPGGITFDVLAGTRYYRFRNQITFNPIDFEPQDKTNDWWDLVVGARAGVQLTECFGLFARGDYGGFDIGHSSRQACNVLVGFDLRCTDCISFYGGYRWFKIDRRAGEGRDAFLLDATLSGPFAALAFRF